MFPRHWQRVPCWHWLLSHYWFAQSISSFPVCRVSCQNLWDISSVQFYGTSIWLQHCLLWYIDQCNIPAYKGARHQHNLQHPFFLLTWLMWWGMLVAQKEFMSLETNVFWKGYHVLTWKIMSRTTLWKIMRWSVIRWATHDKYLTVSNKQTVRLTSAIGQVQIFLLPVDHRDLKLWDLKLRDISGEFEWTMTSFSD